MAGARTGRLTTEPPVPEPWPSPGAALRRELVRKALHLTTVVVPLAYAAGLPRATLLVALAALLVVALVVEWARRRFPALAARFTRLVGSLLRPHEHAGVAGATWLLVACLLAVAVAPKPVAIAATWAVAAGDAAAAIVGRTVVVWRARRAWHVRPVAPAPHVHARKTFAGSAACLAVTVAGALLLARLTWGAALVAGMAAAAAEHPRRPLDDNLRIVVAVVAALALVEAVTT